MKIRPRIVIYSLVLGAAAPAFAAQYPVYFGTGDGKGIYVATFVTDTGVLSPPTLAAEIDRPGFLAIHPTKRFLYSTTTLPSERGAGGVAAFTINPDFTLTRLNVQSSEGRGPAHVSIDATGRCLLVANYESGHVAAMKIKEDGSLASSTSAHKHEGAAGKDERRQAAPHPHAIITNPENTHAYVPDLGKDSVVVYKLDPEHATLSAPREFDVPGSEPMGPRHMKWSLTGRFAYVLNELFLNITVFRPERVPPGGLAYVTDADVLPCGYDEKGLPLPIDKQGLTCSEIRIHPNQQFIYAATRDVANRGRDSISVFHAQETHPGFKRIQVVPAEVGIPRNFNIDPSGTWLLAGGQRSKDVAIFAIDGATGKLKYTGRKVPLECGPICIEFLH